MECQLRRCSLAIGFTCDYADLATGGDLCLSRVDRLTWL